MTKKMINRSGSEVQRIGKKRVTLDLTPQFYDRLTDLERVVGAESKASVIRQALQLYEYVAKRSLRGDVFTATTESGEQEKIVFLEFQ